MREWTKLFWIVLLCSLLLVGMACAKKSTGDDDDDDDTSGDDDSEAPDSGVGSYTVYLNMVPVAIGELVEPTAREVYNAAGEAVSVETIAISDVLAAISVFADDAAKFAYEFVDKTDNTTFEAGLVANEDLANAVFYEDPDMAQLCIGWLEAGHEDHSLCAMENGALITHPVDGAFDLKSIEYINERSGDTPAHLSEEVAAVGVVTVGTGVVVAGQYVKTHIQQDGYGVKIFADTGATESNQGYDGLLFSEVYTFEGDEVFVYGRVTVHDGMIEFVPVSGYHMAVLSKHNELPTPITKTIDELIGDTYRYAGALVRIDDVEMVDVDENDPGTDWPVYANKSKDIRIRNTSGGAKIALPIYEGMGIPGSRKPDDGFDIVGVFGIAGEGYELFPRKIEDVNPTDQTLTGSITVAIYGEERSDVVNLLTLPAGMQVLEDGADPVPVVSIASVIQAADISRNPKKLEYKHVSYDGRKPFETLILDEMKSGLLYQDEPEDDEQPDTMVSSYFYEGMELSEIYFLRGVTDVQCIREVEPPAEGDAVHGEGITLIINGVKYAINFNTLTKTQYEGKEAIALDQFLSDAVIGLFTMDGSFTSDQIKVLYDYRLVSFDGNDEALVTLADMEEGYLIMADPPYTVIPGLGDSARVNDLYIIDMMRYIQVDFGDGGDPVKVYLRDCPTEDVEVEDGVTEPVVFFRTVLEEAGFDITQNTYLYDFYLTASDNFTSFWTYDHNHLSDMYFRPYENRGWTVDPGLDAYGGRVSTKAIYEISLHEVPQEAPSIPVVIDEQTLWGSDANSCEGCHFKNEAIQIPIDCYSCHDAP